MYTNGNNFHLRCTKCETIEYLPIRVEFIIPEKYVSQQMNFILVGICKDCS